MHALPETDAATPCGASTGGLLAALGRPPAGRRAGDTSGTALSGGPTLLERARRIATVLGAGASPVGLLAGNGPDWVAADLGVLLSGRACVPLPAFFSPDQVAHIVSVAGIGSVLGDEPGTLERLLPPCRIRRDGPGGLAVAELDPVPGPDLPAGTAKITFTSGTTGRPKGVCLRQEHLERTARALVQATASLGLRRHLCMLPLATLLENVAGVYGALLSGAECLVPGLQELGLGPDGMDLPRLMESLARLRPDSVILVPELLEALVAGVEAGLPRPASLRFAAVGGARVGSVLMGRAAAAGLPVYEGYGLSECGSVVALNRPGARRPGSVGRPLPHLSVAVAADGEIHVRGGRMAGYLGQAGLDPEGPHATGDLGALDEEGFLYVHGRKDNLIVTTNGRNLSPEWVEAELARQPGLAQAAVFGDARPWPVAVLVPAQGVAGALEDAVAAANRGLPEYARVRAWLAADEPFTRSNGLATANGRPRRAQIAARYRDRIETLYGGQGARESEAANGGLSTHEERCGP